MITDNHMVTLHDGKWCSVRPMTWSLAPGINDNVCPMCVQAIEQGQEVFLLINNHTLFPNRFIHQACQLGSIEFTIDWLRLMWEKAQKYKHWFE